VIVSEGKNADNDRALNLRGNSVDQHTAIITGALTSLVAETLADGLYVEIGEIVACPIC